MDYEKGGGTATEAPPVIGAEESRQYQPSAGVDHLKQKTARWGSLGAIGAVILGKLKFLLPALKFLKLGKVLTTMGTMFLSMWAYSTMFGWTFAAGFVVLILVHEMGHVFVAWRQGLPITAPVFIPFMGAIILEKRSPKSAWAQAWMGIGGPIAGALGAVACHGIFLATGSTFFLGLAYVGYFLNLFNLMPALPLDGGWIVGAISPWLWLLGLAGLTAGFVTGTFHNPLIVILVIMSLPRLWHGLRHGEAGFLGVPATRDQKVVMGVCYLALAGFLVWGMTHVFEHPQNLAPEREQSTRT